MSERYRKKPVVIEAVQLTAENSAEVAAWCGGSEMVAALSPASGYSPSVYDGSLSIPTLEGPHRANPGDFVIRGVQGEFYPCKPDIFAATYEPV